MAEIEYLITCNSRWNIDGKERPGCLKMLMKMLAKDTSGFPPGLIINEKTGK